MVREACDSWDVRCRPGLGVGSTKAALGGSPSHDFRGIIRDKGEVDHTSLGKLEEGVI